MYGLDISRRISKVTFEIPDKISYPYKILILYNVENLRAYKCFSNDTHPKLWDITITNVPQFPWCLIFYLQWHGLTLIPAWISNYIHYKVWDEITYPCWD